MAFEFALTLPPDVLPDVRSSNGRLFWRLDAKSDELGHGSHERVRIAVG